MNKRAGDGVVARKKIPGPRPVGSRDKDEDLMMFREMQKREKDRTVSLLQPVSDEFEATGHYALYGKASNEKNDYDWLKTPPATPLFQSLELETHGPEFAVQRELPIAQSLSRFSAILEAGNENSTQPAKCNTSKPTVPARYSTPTGRPTVSLPEKKNVKSAPVMVNQKLNQPSKNLDRTPKFGSSTQKTAENKEANRNFMATNLLKNTNTVLDSTKVSKPKSRGVSPLVRPQIPAKMADFSDETPPNLRTTSRSTSATRPRSTSAQKRPESVTKTRTQTSTPAGFTLGRKQETDGSLGSHSDKARAQVLGSRMVDRFLNSRMSGTDEKKSQMKQNTSLNEGSDTKNKYSGIEVRQQNNAKFVTSRNDPKIKLNSSMHEASNTARRANAEVRQPSNSKFNTSLNESSGFGRLLSKSSLDMAIRHMKVQDPPRDARISHKHGGRRASSVSKRASSVEEII